MAKTKQAPSPSDEGEVGASANAERGEHELVLAGRTYRLRPSYSAIVAIEDKTERALLELVRIGGGGAMPLGMAGTVAAELIRAGAEEGDRMTKAVSAERIAEMIYEEGVPRIVARLTACLIDGATGGRDASGEAKAVAETTTPEDPATAD